MAGKVLNIEIGDRLGKVCRSVRRGKSFQIENSFLFIVPEGTVTDGFINDPAALAEKLRPELESRGLSDMKEVIFTLASGRIATREVTLPPVKDNRIQALVETNAADYFPVDMSGYNVSYTLLERMKNEEPGLRVMVMAAPSALVETYIRLADLFGWKILSVDYSGNSQFQALRLLDRDSVAMYVNVDPSNAYCSFIGGGEVLLQRTFAFGGHDMIAAYLADHSGDYLSALQELSRPDFDGVTQEEAAEAIERLISSVIRSADFFNSTRDTAVEQIVLMGTCSRLPFLYHLVAAESGIDTVYLEELPGIGQLANSAEGISGFVSCIGSSIAPADFLPESYKTRRKQGLLTSKQTDSLSGGIVICAVCVAASLVLCAFSVLGYLSERQDLEAAQNRISELASVQRTYDTYVAYTDTVNGLQVVKDAAEGQNAQLENFFLELEQKMPSEIVMLTASCTEEGVTMNVAVPSYAEAAVVISQLRTFQSIDVVSVTEVAMEEDTGVSRANFTVTCQYPAPEQKENADSGQTAANAGSDTGTADDLNAAASGTEG